AAGSPASKKGALSDALLLKSEKMPRPPSTVNQKCDIAEATMETRINISLIVRPRATRATRIPIKGPYPINQPKKNNIQAPDHSLSPLKVLILTNSVI